MLAATCPAMIHFRFISFCVWGCFLGIILNAHLIESKGLVKNNSFLSHSRMACWVKGKIPALRITGKSISVAEKTSPAPLPQISRKVNSFEKPCGIKAATTMSFVHKEVRGPPVLT